MIPAYAATLLKKEGYEVIWDDAIAEEKTHTQWLKEVEKEVEAETKETKSETKEERKS
jgi:thiamine biosynthesis protein ThiC